MCTIKKISVIVLIGCFLLIHGGVAPVYSGGTEMVIPDAFNDYLTTIFNALLDSKSLPDIPSSTPQNTLTISTTIDQKYYTPSTLAPSSFYNSPEHKTELAIPYQLSPLSSDQPLLPMARPYAVTICLPYNDSTAPGCIDKMTTAQASEILAAMILQKYFKGAEIRPFRVVMPSIVPPEMQNRILCQIETDAIYIIESKILEDLKKSKIFSSESEEGRLHKQNIIIEDAKTAREDAQKGINWSHTSKEDRSTHAFHEGKAFVKLDKALVSGRLPERK